MTKPKAEQTQPLARRSAAVTPLPAVINRMVGHRLRILRESRGLFTREVDIFGTGSLINYEIHNASSIKLGDLVAYARYLNMDLLEFLTFLFENDDEEHAARLDPQQLRIDTLVASFPPARRRAAADLLQWLANIESL